MPRMVQKCGYSRSGGAGRYARYIATREGVEKLHGRGPATTRQKELIRDVLRDYPDSRELFEYEDYRANPTFSNASAFLTMALDANVHTMEEGSVYLQYIATRPRVERRGDHGLFSDREALSLPDTMAEVDQHQGPVWTVIYSLRREDAAALGYNRSTMGASRHWIKCLIRLLRLQFLHCAVQSISFVPCLPYQKPQLSTLCLMPQFLQIVRHPYCGITKMPSCIWIQILLVY